MIRSWNVWLLLGAIGFTLITSTSATEVEAEAQPDGRPTCQKLSDVQIVQLLNRWRAAFKSGSVEQLSTLYADDATLVATQDGKSYKGRDAIRTYYKDLFTRHPMLSIRPASIAAGCGSATVSGPVVYRITGLRKGTRMLLGGQYMAEFELVGEQWEIVRHSLAADPRAIGEPFDKGAAQSSSDL